LKHLLIILAFILTLTNLSRSQSIDETLSNLSEDAGIAYVGPIISAFGSNMNSGWVNGVPSASILGLDIQIRLIAIGSFFNDEDKTFVTHGKFWFTSSSADDILQASGIDPGNTPNYEAIKSEILSQPWNVDIGGPTIIGNHDEDVKIIFPGAEIQGVTIDSTITTLSGASGFLDGVPVFPTPAIQLNIGSIAGTNVSIRYFPNVHIGDVGEAGLWGLGILHNIGFWFSNPLPIEIGLGYFYQDLDIGNVFQNKSNMFGIYASKSFGMIVSFEPYVGLTYETSRTTMQYTYYFDTPLGPQSQSINVDLDGENSVGLTIGAQLNLPIVSLNVDYKIAKIKTLTAGINFGF
jgi:uncharacterized membrane protein